MSFIQKIVRLYKFKYSPTIPNLNVHNHESRRNWILFMAKRTGQFPVREILDRMTPQVSHVTVNNDLKALEAEGLIRREKDKLKQRSYVYPLFEDSGEASLSKEEQQKQFFLKWGLPFLSVALFLVLILVHILK